MDCCSCVQVGDDEAPWQGITAQMALARLRDTLEKCKVDGLALSCIAYLACLASLQVPDARQYGTHSFRRGHAQVRCQLGGRLPFGAVAFLLAGHVNSRCYAFGDPACRPMEKRSLYALLA